MRAWRPSNFHADVRAGTDRRSPVAQEANGDTPNDLCERLRYQTRYTRGLVPVTMDEAANRIEQLESRLAEIEGAELPVAQPVYLKINWREGSKDDMYTGAQYNTLCTYALRVTAERDSARRLLKDDYDYEPVDGWGA